MDEQDVVCGRRATHAATSVLVVNPVGQWSLPTVLSLDDAMHLAAATSRANRLADGGE